MILVLLGLMLCTVLAVPTAAAPAPQFQSGDVVALVGDSITHGRKWHRYVYEYYLTRFPDWQVRFVNEGIAGDSAGGAL
ncbi:MAG: GDSL family lipase, partial [Armatimonadota bacterium]